MCGGSPTITGCYYTETMGDGQGKQVETFTSSPANLGSLVKNYGLLTAYQKGILLDGTYYVITSLPGSGTAVAPYTISNTDEWNLFTTLVNNGTENYNGEFVSLTDDITVSETVGRRDNKPFSGTFLGGGHTITANISSTTTGTGGIVGHGRSSTTTLRGCVFAGTIKGVGGDRSNIGAIWGWSDDGATPTLEDCLEAGTYTGITSMHPMGLQSGKGTITNCYYMNAQVGTPRNACTVEGAKQAEASESTPQYLGDEKQYALLTVYANGILFGGKYYKAPDIFETLTDDDTYTRTEDYEVTTATYTKTTDRVDKYHAWLVPFDYTITTADLEKFTFYKINMIANSPAPETEATDAMWLFVKKMQAEDVLHANMPYIYMPKEAVTDYEFTTENAVLKAKDTGVILKTETAEDVYSFYATYGSTMATAEAPFYYVANDGTVCYGDNVTLGSMRWLIRKTNKYGDTPSYARQMIIFDGEEPNVTGVKGVKVIVVNDDSWYSLDGRRLQGKPSRAGVYIYIMVIRS